MVAVHFELWVLALCFIHSFAQLPAASTTKNAHRIVASSKIVWRGSLGPIFRRAHTRLPRLHSAGLKRGLNSQEASHEEYKDVIRKYWRFRSRGEMFEELSRMGIDTTAEEVNRIFKNDQSRLLDWLVDEVAARVRKYSPRNRKGDDIIDNELTSRQEGSVSLMESLQEGIAIRKDKTKQTDEMRSILARGAPRDIGYFPKSSAWFDNGVCDDDDDFYWHQMITKMNDDLDD
mmetsp:Transcript_12200/g.16934  ORF Transcript_12200/g.16934 Transcript_12200/m.16934 type:complete len:232 (-) Transcript_12200:18-713(-)